MTPPTPRPTKIALNRQPHTLAITWNDAHESVFPWDGLRAVCPCVMCRGGHANMGGPADPALLRQPDRGVQTLTRVELVGSYALQCFWGDGHETGIYTWGYLREACPCAECNA